jgi:hypothetical protein
MGSGIAEVLARAGRQVVVHEVNVDSAQRGRVRIETSLGRAVRSGRLAEEERNRVLGRIVVGSDLAALADAEIVVEAASEDAAVKTELFAGLDEVLVRDDAVLASNTSSIPIMKLGTATQRPEQVVPCTSSTRCRCCLSSRSCRRCSRAARQWRGCSDSPRKSCTRPSSARRTEPASSSTPCLCLTCSAGSACSSRVTPPRTTSTPAWSEDAPTRWARCSSVTSSGSHRQGHRRVAVRGVQGAAVLPAADAASDGAGGPARPQERPWLPRVLPRLTVLAPGSEPDDPHRLETA